MSLHIYFSYVCVFLLDVIKPYNLLLFWVRLNISPDPGFFGPFAFLYSKLLICFVYCSSELYAFSYFQGLSPNIYCENFKLTEKQKELYSGHPWTHHLKCINLIIINILLFLLYHLSFHPSFSSFIKPPYFCARQNKLSLSIL